MNILGFVLDISLVDWGWWRKIDWIGGRRLGVRLVKEEVNCVGEWIIESNGVFIFKIVGSY